MKMVTENFPSAPLFVAAARSGCLPLILLIVLVGCEAPVEEAIIPTASPATALVVPRSAKPYPYPSLLADGFAEDSLASVLLPIFLDSPEKRRVEEWLQLRKQWMPLFGEIDNLLFFLQRYYDLAREEGDVERAYRIRNAMGRIHAYNADYPRALEAQQEAYTLAQGLRDSVMMGWVLNSMGSPHIMMGNDSTALEIFTRSMALAQKIRHPGVMALSHLNQGTAYASAGRMREGIRAMEDALLLADQHGLVVIGNVARLNLSTTYAQSGEYDRAIRYLRDNLDTESERVDLITSFLNLNMYEAYVGKGDFAAAERYLEKGCAMSDSIGFGYGSLMCQQYRAQLAERRGSPAVALEEYKEFHKLQLEQTGAEAQREVQTLEAKMQLREKDFEIASLNEASKTREASHRRSRNLLFGGLGLTLLGLLGVFLGMRVRHRAKMAEQARVVAETKLQVLQSQMNPHFIFNAMSGIQNYILKSEKIDAYNYLGKFSALLRIIAKHSAEFHIELEEEIRLLRTYLELEKLRFREALTYRITVDEELETATVNIPSMMIQPIVENAMLHGLAGLERPGMIDVSVCNCSGGVVCVVTDNGRGRKVAAEIKSRLGREAHLSIASVNTEKRLAFLRNIGYANAHVETEDLYEAGEPTGTRVTIFLPIVNPKNFS